MYLEFFIAGLTGFFLWLLLRHLIAFHRDRLRQRAGGLLRKAQMPWIRAVLGAAAQSYGLLVFCGFVLLEDYFFFFVKFGFFENIKFSVGSHFPDAGVFIDLQVFFGAVLLPSLGSLVLGRGKNFFMHRMRFSFAIHENGIVYQIGIFGMLAFIPWEQIEYLLWSPARKKFFLQRKGRRSFLRRRFSVVDGETLADLLSRFVEVRGWDGNTHVTPERPRVTMHEPSATKTAHWRFPRFQFDLLSLMLLTLVFASSASWYAYHQHRSQPIKAAVASLAEFQPTVTYHDVDVRYLLFGETAKNPVMRT